MNSLNPNAKKHVDKNRKILTEVRNTNIQRNLTNCNRDWKRE